MNSNSKGHNLACALREVANFSRDDLVQHWQSQYGCLPPKGVKRNYWRGHTSIISKSEVMEH